LKPALVLTDLNLPDIDGVDFIHRIHQSKETNVIAVSARTSLNCVIAALDAGAEDFIPKPFSIGELAARVRTALRHASMNREPNRNSFRSGELEVDFTQRRVRISGRDVHLTPLEYRMLSMLIENAGRVLSYDRLLRAWTSQKRRQLQHVRVLMYQLRRKVEADPGEPSFLITASGGYLFKVRGQ
jgi:two-component system KDP operon response regulator KdpE